MLRKITVASRGRESLRSVHILPEDLRRDKRHFPCRRTGIEPSPPENQRMPSENGRFSLFLFLCPRRDVDNKQVTQTENGSDLIKNGPPLLL